MQEGQGEGRGEGQGDEARGTGSSSPSEPAGAAGGSRPSNDERNLALVMYLLTIPFHVLAPLVVWLVKKDESEYLGDQAKEALNFQITVLIAYALLSWTCFLAPVVFAANAVFNVIAALKVKDGERYRFPFALRLIS